MTINNPSGNKKRDPGGAAFTFSTVISLYHKVMGYCDIFAEIYSVRNQWDSID